MDRLIARTGSGWCRSGCVCGLMGESVGEDLTVCERVDWFTCGCFLGLIAFVGMGWVCC